MPANFISNNPDNFEQGALYNGGSGTLTDMRYVLWDYDGKQPPDSAVAVKYSFQPTDGSNEGKLVENNYWSVGPASDFVPDPTGGHLIPVKTRSAQGSSSNWAFVLSKFKLGCGLDTSLLDGPTGILALIGSDLTLARIDQPKREGLNDDDKPAGEGGGKKFKATILVPTKAKFPWEKKAGSAGAASKPQVAASANANAAPAATVASKATVGQTATPTVDGAPSDLAGALAVILTESGGSIEFDAIPASVIEKLKHLDRGPRMEIIKQAKNREAVAEIAKANNWTLSATELMAV